MKTTLIVVLMVVCLTLIITNIQQSRTLSQFQEERQTLTTKIVSGSVELARCNSRADTNEALFGEALKSAEYYKGAMG